MNRLSKIRTALLEAVFPSDLYCIRCGRIINRSRYDGLCDKCSEGFNWIGTDVCDKCGRLLARRGRPGEELGGIWRGADDDERLCAECRENGRYFDKGYTCAFYGVYAREIVAAMKTKNRPWIGRKLGEAMADRMACEDEPIDLVIPVPVHHQREKKRGYNQAEVIARQFVETYNRKHSKSEDAREQGSDRKASGKAVFLDALARTRETAPMKGLNVWERKANIEGAFEMKPWAATIIEGRSAALVDDIMTTGNTLSECARVLKEAGAARVIAVTFAAGGDMNANDEGSW